jgi:hypothetical protein
VSTGKQLLSFRRGFLLTSSGCSSPNVEPVLGLVDPEERGAKPIRSESNSLPVNTVLRPRKHQHLSHRCENLMSRSLVILDSRTTE